MGYFFVNAAFNRDYAVMMGITILVGALTILFSLIADLLYGLDRSKNKILRLLI